MAPEDSRELGLFPLGLVILPGERIPLHIFEPRYRALMADCALGSRPFVISLATDDGVARVGCTTMLDALLRRFDDGRMNVVVEGGERVEIVAQTSGQAYVTARVRALSDEDSAPDAALSSKVADGFRRLAEAVAGAARDPDVRDGVPLSYAVAGAMELDAVTKQRLLEERSEAERLAAVADLIENALSGLDRQAVAAERAKTNGKVTLQ
jgi:ATP-dependent Lon protease